jgi:hypothetical protein
MRRDVKEPKIAEDERLKEQEKADEGTLEIKEHETIAEPRKFSALVNGKEYEFKEMTLAGKMHVLSLIPESFERFLRNFRIKQTPDGGMRLEVAEETTFADVQLDRLIASSAEALLYMLGKSFPSYEGDWNELPESETRNAIVYAMLLNGWGAFIQNFFITAKRAGSLFIRQPSSQE